MKKVCGLLVASMLLISTSAVYACPDYKTSPHRGCTGKGCKQCELRNIPTRPDSAKAKKPQVSGPVKPTGPAKKPVAPSK
jgi:hypothetical protein